MPVDRLTGNVCAVYPQKLYPKSLKHLADEFLNLKIQTGEHDSVRQQLLSLDPSNTD
jgi:hypothetical protein